MIYTETEIPGVWIIEPKVFKDARGYFMEAFKQEEFDAYIGPTRFIQDNESTLCHHPEAVALLLSLSGQFREWLQQPQP